MVRRIYTVLIFLAAAVVLSACGGGGSSEATKATGPIKIWYSDNPQEISWGKATVKRWNEEHPKEKVTGQEIPAGETSEAVIQAAITAGNAPCLVWNVAPAAVPQFQRAGGLVPLDSFDGGVEYARKRTGDRVDQYVSSDGKLYQLPWKSNPVMIIYNKDLFQKAGLDPENPKVATYDEFFQTSKTINSKLGIAPIWPSADQTFYQSWFDYYPTFIAATGGDQLVENGKAQFDSATGLEVADFWRSMYDAGLIPQESSPVDAFAEEKSAMSMVGPWAVAVYTDVDWGVVPVPTPDGKSPEEIHTFSDAKNVSIFSACKNQKTAFEYMKFATSEESDGRLLEMTGQMPLREGLEQKYADFFDENPLYAKFAEQSSRTVEVPNVENSIQMWQKFRATYSESVIFGKEPVDKAFPAAAKDIEEIIKGHGR
ncbi:MAG TPA: extracellular solute-binding protein [Rubrobacter sp.]|nr:extracellular solute-binding protein [Rubrobacter sp.]